MVNSWVEMYQSTRKAILHIYGDVARRLTQYPRVKEVNPWVELFQTTSNAYFTSPLTSKEIFLDVKELLG